MGVSNHLTYRMKKQRVYYLIALYKPSYQIVKMRLFLNYFAVGLITGTLIRLLINEN